MKKNDPYLAAGTSDLTARIATLKKEIASDKVKLGQWQQNYNANETVRKNLYEKAYGGYCANEFINLTKRRECQADLNTRLAESTAKVAKATSEISLLKSRISANEVALSQAETELESYNTFVQQAANQGLSPEAAHQAAMAQVEQEAARTKAQESKSRMTRYIVGGLIVLTIAGVSYYAYKKYLKKVK